MFVIVSSVRKACQMGKWVGVITCIGEWTTSVTPLAWHTQHSHSTTPCQIKFLPDYQIINCAAKQFLFFCNFKQKAILYLNEARSINNRTDTRWEREMHYADCCKWEGGRIPQGWKGGAVRSEPGAQEEKRVPLSRTFWGHTQPVVTYVSCFYSSSYSTCYPTRKEWKKKKTLMLLWFNGWLRRCSFFLSAAALSLSSISLNWVRNLFF